MREAAWFSSRVIRFTNRLAWATLIGLTYCTALTLPTGRPSPVAQALLYLDVPVTAVHFLLPWRLGLGSGFSGFWLPGRTYCFPQSPSVELFRYLRVCIPTYMLLFYAPSFFGWLARRVRLWRGVHAAAPGV
jgi:hypothetical protein